MERLIHLNIPSLCVFNGRVAAGGAFLGLCHDFRIMNAAEGSVCLTELLFGQHLVMSLSAVLKAKLAPTVVTKLEMAVKLKPLEALKDGIISDLYTDSDDLNLKVRVFS